MKCSLSVCSTSFLAKTLILSKSVSFGASVNIIGLLPSSALHVSPAQCEHRNSVTDNVILF